MNDSEIKAEAKKRIDKMTEKEKKDIWGFSEEDNKIADYAMKVGVSNLNPSDTKKFRTMLENSVSKRLPGGAFQSGMINGLEEHFGIKIDDINKGTKNPYKAKLLKDIVLALIVNVAAAGLAIGGLGPAALAVEAATGVFAVDFASQIKKYFDFKKLKKKAMNGELTEEMIQAEVFEQLHNERRTKWNR